MDRIASVLSVAASTGRVAYVYLEHNVPVRWGMSRHAAANTQNAARIVQSWLDDCRPDLMISQKPETAFCKGARTRDILETIGTLFDNAEGLNVRLTRQQSYQNKYEEAKALAAKFPALAHLLPTQPPLWLPEPRNMSYFEALALVEQLKTPQSE